METPETASKRFQRILNEMLEKFKKTPFVIPVAVALSAGLFYLVIAYAGGNCLAPLLPPLGLLGLLWYFGIRTVKKMILIGVVACLVFTGVWIYALTGSYQSVDRVVATSEDGTTLNNGTVTPLHATASATFQFNLTVRNETGKEVTIDSVRVVYGSFLYPSRSISNQSMNRVTEPVAVNDSGTIFWVTNYSFSTTISTAVNDYYFVAEVNNSWLYGLDYAGTGAGTLIVGPVFNDSFAVASALTTPLLLSVYASTFPIYAIMVLMIWWTRRARTMRETQVKKWQEEREKEEASAPSKGKTKTPSLQKAMGLEDETFVCSECGADVPADATVCPKCGEKFE